MKTWIALIVFCLFAGFGISTTLMRIAEAQVASVDAGVPPAPDGMASSPDGLGSSPTIAAVDWNPLHWDWPWIVGTLATVLGGIIMLLRPIAAATKWTGDNWLLAKLEWLLGFITRLFLPASMRKDNVKFPKVTP